METIGHYITFNYKKHEELDELDLELKDALIPEEDSATYIPTFHIIKGLKDGWQAETEPVLIDTLINELTKFKKTCNYVEIMFHHDHHGYVLNGVEITVSSEAEIKSYNSIKAKRQEKQGQINKLRDELEKLEKDI